MRPDIMIVLLAAGFWESWRWLLQRTWVTPDEAITLAVMFIVVGGRLTLHVSRGGRLAQLPLLPFGAAVIAYATAIMAGVPSIVCAAVAAATLLSALHIATVDRAPPLAFWGLCCLVLPVVPTLQFYLGYPMRLVSSALTVPLLKLNGLDVGLEGTALIWRDQHIQFDAPCSGVTMAWAGMLLVFVVGTAQDFNARQLIRAVLLGLRLLLAANVLRAASLFYLEAGIVPGGGEALHQAIGLAAFALALLIMIRHLRRVSPCEA